MRSYIRNTYLIMYSVITYRPSKIVHNMHGINSVNVNPCKSVIIKYNFEYRIYYKFIVCRYIKWPSLIFQQKYNFKKNYYWQTVFNIIYIGNQ